MSTAIIHATRHVRIVKQSSGGSGSGGFVAPDDDLVEVLGYRAMRLTLRIFSFEGTGPMTAVFLMETGMDLKDPNGFVSLGLFDAIGEAPTSTQRVFTDLQRYVRWRILVLDSDTDPGDAVVQFSIEGIVYQ